MIKRQTSLGFTLKRDGEMEERLAYDDMRKKLLNSLKRVFRPEFINRLDSVIVFRSLNKDDIKQIVDLELNKVATRLVEHSVVLTATPAALDLIGDQGYDPEMGARPLRRVIQQKVEDPLSDGLLSGEFEDGEAITVDVEDGDIKLRKTEEQPSQPSETVELGSLRIECPSPNVERVAIFRFKNSTSARQSSCREWPFLSRFVWSSENSIPAKAAEPPITLGFSPPSAL